MTNLDHFVLRPRRYDHPHAARLVRALFDDQTQRYGYADPFEADPAGYAPPRGLFLVGYLDDRPVACGGYRTYDVRTRTVEIKKMYTLPELRGHGLGERIITELEQHARESGARRSILETGVRNIAALALYAGVGYQPTARYVCGRDPAINRAFIKDLAGCPAMP
ncbi:GNAT family N-acetyltransferase [Spongiactinospora gelatinilytica]|uniref:GNAT family N-acetyltransferase n=1 Tax=Spongiactinospora gelatinilytica TaxID=2666298 RepID=A0A2W2I178_9ACTN|nr:GNAT family N-acetyltransferase [Spongiactinospora gelatinilytica]PZG44544.1 GNAT family N-acetyltransferase [Spongiactinospora gelatinilytica]